MLHALGGLLLLAIVLAVFGRMFGRQAVRSWDILRPGTRPTRREAARQLAAFARSGVSAARAGWVRSMPSGFRGIPLTGVVLGSHDDPVTDEGGDRDDEDPAPEMPARPQAPEPAPPAPRVPTGRTVPVSTPAASGSSLVPGEEEMTTGTARLGAFAANGNMRQKKDSFGALSRAWEADSATVLRLARSMAEDSRYSTRVIEAAERVAQVLRALSMEAAEVESMLAGILARPVDDLIDSGEAPERRELMAEPGSL